jgi:glutamate/tyrosine decarboxylase-like PLP-dependent enzyme
VTVEQCVRMSSPCMHMLSVLFHACTKCVDVIEPVVCGIQVSGGTAGIIVVCVWGSFFERPTSWCG